VQTGKEIDELQHVCMLHAELVVAVSFTRTTDKFTSKLRVELSDDPAR
jgi:hypothetical protein